MRNILLFMACALLATGCRMAPNLRAMGGVRDFQGSGEWESTDKQTNVYGVGVDLAGKDGFGPEFGFTHSEDVSNDDRYINRKVDDTKTVVKEVYFGLRKNWMVTDSWQVSVSGGVSSLTLETYVDLSYAGTPHDRGQGYAPYIDIGTSWFFTENFFLGAEYRRHFMNEDVDIFIIDPELDCDMFLVTMGWSF